MAIIPRMPSDSFDELLSNLQEAQAKGQPRGMALPHTYLRFYKKSEIVAPGIINSAIVLWLTLAILTRVLLVQSLVFRLKYFLWRVGSHKPRPVPQDQNGTIGMNNLHMVMIPRISSGFSKE